MSKPLELTDVEMERMRQLVKEAALAAESFRAMFAGDTKGLLMFLLALGGLQGLYPGLFDKADHATMIVAEWVAAGEPEDVKEVMKRLKERMEL